MLQLSTDSFSTAFRQSAPQPLWATARHSPRFRKALKIKAIIKNKVKKRTARRTP
ncbi:hypothetical protein [Pseudomonas knackmussii]|uniref:hypothetical protein n=1 Tax=Pseudomonas knackmussii TaxID=65741 RepID=UPI0013644B6D|nr:hypothetical protein [Pseudomonas knackmussii]